MKNEFANWRKTIVPGSSRDCNRKCNDPLLFTRLLFGLRVAPSEPASQVTNIGTFPREDSREISASIWPQRPSMTWNATQARHQTRQARIRDSNEIFFQRKFRARYKWRTVLCSSSFDLHAGSMCSGWMKDRIIRFAVFVSCRFSGGLLFSVRLRSHVCRCARVHSQAKIAWKEARASKAFH